MEPNGIALKTSYKKGLVKGTASLLIIEDSVRKLWQSSSILTTDIKKRISTNSLLKSFVFDFF